MMNIAQQGRDEIVDAPLLECRAARLQEIGDVLGRGERDTQVNEVLDALGGSQVLGPPEHQFAHDAIELLNKVNTNTQRLDAAH